LATPCALVHDDAKATGWPDDTPGAGVRYAYQSIHDVGTRKPRDASEHDWISLGYGRKPAVDGGRMGTKALGKVGYHATPKGSLPCAVGTPGSWAGPFPECVE